MQGQGLASSATPDIESDPTVAGDLVEYDSDNPMLEAGERLTDPLGDRVVRHGVTRVVTRPQLAGTSWISSSTMTLSPMRTPPASRGTLKSTPKSLRLMVAWPVRWVLRSWSWLVPPGFDLLDTSCASPIHDASSTWTGRAD